MAGTSVLRLPVLGRRAVNAYLLLGRRPILVDSGTPGSAPRITDAIAGHGVDPTDIALIVVTHAHIDHFGSAAELHRSTGAPVAGHAADLEQYLRGASRRPLRPTGLTGRFLATRPAIRASVEPIRPQVLLTGRMPLADFGVDATIEETPGHTAGSVSVLTDAGDLVAGDLVATPLLGSVGRRPANPPFHDDPLANLASLRAMLALRPTRLHVGHGGALDPGAVERWMEREHRKLTRRASRGHRPRAATDGSAPPR